MKVKTEIKCEGCGFKTLVVFIKPNYFVPTTGVFNCDSCKSKIQFIAKKGKELDNKVTVTTKFVTISKELQEILDEDKKYAIRADGNGL